MLLKKSDWPEEDELVLASVTRVNPNSVFCTLDHYGGRTGLIHISEISPGRIRNIRDYVVEGKKAVCKILKIDKDKGHIDLSLRRVTEIQKRNFNDQLKQEQKAEKLIKVFAEQEKLKVEDMQKGFIKKIGEDYDFVYDFFTDVVEGSSSVSEYVEDSVLAKKLEAFVREKITPPEVSLKNIFSLSISQPNGVELLKKALGKLISENISISYQGAGKYVILVKDKDYKKAEKTLESTLSLVKDFAEKQKGVFLVQER